MVNIKVSGMSCTHCKAAVEGALKEVAGVTDVQVDLDKGVAVVQGTASVEPLLKAIEEAGYSAEVAGEEAR